MKKKIFLVVIVMSFIYFLQGCGGSSQSNSFHGLTVDLSNASAIGLGKPNVRPVANNSFFHKVYADDNNLSIVKVTEDNNVEELVYLDNSNEESKLDYKPVYLKAEGNFTAVIYVHNKMYTEEYSDNLLDIEFALKQATMSSNPISNFVSNGNIDHILLRNIDEDEFRQVTVVFIHNETGKTFELSEMLKEDEKSKVKPTSIYNLYVYEDTINLTTRTDDSRNNIILTYTFNNDSKSMEREMYNPELDENSFRVVFTNNYQDTIFMSNGIYKILKEDRTVNEFSRIFYDNHNVFLTSGGDAYFMENDGNININWYKVVEDGQLEDVFSKSIDSSSEIWKYIDEIIMGEGGNDEYIIEKFHHENKIYIFINATTKITFDLELNEVIYEEVELLQSISTDNRLLEYIEINDRLFIIGNKGILEFNYNDDTMEIVIEDVQIELSSLTFQEGMFTFNTINELNLSKTKAFINISSGDIYLGEEQIPSLDVVIIEPLN